MVFVHSGKIKKMVESVGLGLDLVLVLAFDLDYVVC